MAITVANLERLEAKLKTLTPRAKELIKRANDLSAKALVARVQAVAPRDAKGPHPGALRDSVHAETGQTETASRVVVDAVDAKGKGYAPHVEYGHKTPDGKHVRAEPFFWPSVRSLRKSAISRSARALTTAAKQGALSSSGSE